MASMCEPVSLRLGGRRQRIAGFWRAVPEEKNGLYIYSNNSEIPNVRMAGWMDDVEIVGQKNEMYGIYIIIYIIICN